MLALLLGVLAVFGVGWRLASARAGAIAALALISFPLWSLQSRQLAGELPGAVGGALIIYALAAIAAPRKHTTLALAIDLLVAAAALYSPVSFGIGQVGGNAFEQSCQMVRHPCNRGRVE